MFHASLVPSGFGQISDLTLHWKSAWCVLVGKIPDACQSFKRKQFGIYSRRSLWSSFFCVWWSTLKAQLRSVPDYNVSVRPKYPAFSLDIVLMSSLRRRSSEAEAKDRELFAIKREMEKNYYLLSRYHKCDEIRQQAKNKKERKDKRNNSQWLNQLLLRSLQKSVAVYLHIWTLFC